MSTPNSIDTVKTDLSADQKSVDISAEKKSDESSSSNASVIPPSSPAPTTKDSAINNIVDDKVTTNTANDDVKVVVADVAPIEDQLANMTIFGNKSLDELHRIQSQASHLSAGILFSDPSLQIPKSILESLTIEMRFEKPSQIQASTLPLILRGENIIAQAQSGAGKTIAFVIGMLSKVQSNINCVQALCVTPTRELALQIVKDAVKPLSTRIPNLRVEEAVPTTGMSAWKGSVSTSQIIVGTPGTVKTMIRERYFDTKAVKIFVLDEADTMVQEKAHGADTMFIRKGLGPSCQILLFSATYTPEIISYAKQMTPRAYVITPRSRQELVLGVIFQVSMNVNKCVGGKLQILKDIYDFLTVQQSIVFVETKASSDKVAHMMRAGGFAVSVLHGGLAPEDRDVVMEDFRKGRTKVLITTNVLARGVDVPAVAVVVNYDLPVLANRSPAVADEATYLHRIGRCGRFGRRGTAINFVETPDDHRVLAAIEEHYRPGNRFITEWDPTDVPGLSDAIKARPEGGEIHLEATTGCDDASYAKDGVHVSTL